MALRSGMDVSVLFGAFIPQVLASLPPMASSTAKISQEIWDMITDHLPALSARYAATALDFHLRPQQEKLAGIWGALFRDLTWISRAGSTGCGPVLIGKDLDRCWEVIRPERPYLVLLAKPFESKSEKELFLRCLRGPQEQADCRELELSSGVILNVAYLYDSNDRLHVKITDVFEQRKRVRTAILFWRGSSIDLVNLETLVGASGEHSVLKAFVGYRLTLKFLDARVQYLFEPHSPKIHG